MPPFFRNKRRVVFMVLSPLKLGGAQHECGEALCLLAGRLIGVLCRLELLDQGSFGRPGEPGSQQALCQTLDLLRNRLLLIRCFPNNGLAHVHIGEATAHQAQGEVDPADQRAAGDPLAGILRVARREPVVKEGLAQASDLTGQQARIGLAVAVVTLYLILYYDGSIGF